MMVGLGEEWDEVVATLADLRSAGCQIVTIGQYLRPSLANLPMVRYYAPAEFAELKRIGARRWASATSSPVRSCEARITPTSRHRPTKPHAEVNPLDLVRHEQSSPARHVIRGCVRYCERIAIEKKAAHRGDAYWGRPVPGFGDPDARLLVLGLAPAAHGANRTGRVFTGDGSGDFLMRAMHAPASRASRRRSDADDGLALKDAYIAAAVRCAPPDNKPTPDEIAACHAHLVAEVAALPQPARDCVSGQDRVRCRLAPSRFTRHRRAAAAGRSATARSLEPAGPTVIASYHPSRQNTNTGKLTPPMLASVFQTASAHVRSPQTLALG